MMKVNLFTLYVNDYRPECKAAAFPAFERYAAVNGFNFHPIETRRYPGLPATYEKVQIHELGRDADWNILVDVDWILLDGFPNLIKAAGIPGIATVVHTFFMYQIFKTVLPETAHLEVSPGAAFVISDRASHDIWKPLPANQIQRVLDSLWVPKHLDEATLLLNSLSVPLKHVRWADLGVGAGTMRVM